MRSTTPSMTCGTAPGETMICRLSATWGESSQKSARRIDGRIADRRTVYHRLVPVVYDRVVPGGGRCAARRGCGSGRRARRPPPRGTSSRSPPSAPAALRCLGAAPSRPTLRTGRAPARANSSRQMFNLITCLSIFMSLYLYSYLSICISIYVYLSVFLSTGPGSTVTRRTCPSPPTTDSTGISANSLVQGSGFRVQGSGFRVQGLGFRV